MTKYLIAISVFLLGTAALEADSLCTISGVVRDKQKTVVTAVVITAKKLDDGSIRKAVSGPDGAWRIPEIPSGTYSLTAEKEGYAPLAASSLQVEPGKAVAYDVTIDPAVTNIVTKGFWGRLAKAYADDWHDRGGGGPDPKVRGYQAPESNPPYPFTVWPYGGSPVIGQPNTNLPPLMAALYNGPHGEWWQNSKIQIYGWVDTGFNVSSSNRGEFANAPAAYDIKPNTITLDQAVLYIERVPDTVQTDHFDWGFRLSGLYGQDYRYTTSKGIFSNQLLGKNSLYGADPVMVYADLYFPKVADGMNVRIGRYVSLPDIEAQLAPNNYTYSHSLLYIYDCYTQSGINVTTKLSDHWMIQTGLSGGCDSALWTKDATPTGTFCGSYTWSEGGDNFYVCANSVNKNKYAYNNLAAYYLTWYHKINSKWHFDTELWYQYERDVPSIFGTAPIENGANGAWCNPGQQYCFAPEWATTNYVERQFGKKDALSIRNEVFDDLKGQRTGTKTLYSEHLISWTHFIGTSLLFRPEIRYERSYDNPAYDLQTKKNQVIVAGDMVFFY